MCKEFDRVIEKFIQPEFDPICVQVFEKNFESVLSQIIRGEIQKDKNNYAPTQALRIIMKMAEKIMRDYYNNHIHKTLLDNLGECSQKIMTYLFFELEDYIDYEHCFNESKALMLFEERVEEMIKEGLCDEFGELLQFNKD